MAANAMQRKSAFVFIIEDLIDIKSEMLSLYRCWWAGAEDALMVYTAARNIYEKTESVEYIYEGMFVSEVENEIYTVSLKVKTTGIDGSTAERDFTVQLINEESVGWRLHGASYATHY